MPISREDATRRCFVVEFVFLLSYAHLSLGCKISTTLLQGTGSNYWSAKLTVQVRKATLLQGTGSNYHNPLSREDAKYPEITVGAQMRTP